MSLWWLALLGPLSFVGLWFSIVVAINWSWLREEWKKL